MHVAGKSWGTEEAKWWKAPRDKSASGVGLESKVAPEKKRGKARKFFIRRQSKSDT